MCVCNLLLLHVLNKNVCRMRVWRCPRAQKPAPLVSRTEREEATDAASRHEQTSTGRQLKVSHRCVSGEDGDEFSIVQPLQLQRAPCMCPRVRSRAARRDLPLHIHRHLIQRMHQRSPRSHGHSHSHSRPPCRSLDCFCRCAVFCAPLFLRPWSWSSC